MVELVQKYVTIYRSVELKGWGKMEFVSTPARLDFPNRLLHAPGMALHFDAKGNSSQAFIDWLAAETSISAAEAAQQVASFVAAFEKELQLKQKIDWVGWGIFYRSNGAEAKFQSVLDQPVAPVPVTAEKVIRKGAEHRVRVGEDDRSSYEMEELLAAGDATSKRRWWMGAAALLICSGLLLWYFNQSHPLQFRHSASFQPIKPAPAPQQYTEGSTR